MEAEYPVTQIGDLVASISETHKFDKERLIFLNTSDILHGHFLHRKYSAVRDWPGQAKKSIRKDDILFSEIRPSNGRWAYVDEDADDFVVSTKLMVIRAKTDRVYPKFVYQFLTSSEITDWLQHLAESRSGTFPQITFDQVASLELPLPSLAEQKRIAHILGTLDEKIELNRRMNATLESMARTLFQSWFVVFDAVRAKMEGRKPEGMDDATAALFPAAYEETKVGNIPAGWRLGSFSDLCNLKRGHDLPTSTRTAGDIPVISSSGSSGTHSETNVRGPGVVTGRYGTIGKVFYIEGDFWPLNTTLYIDDFKGSPPRFIYHALGEMNFAKYIDKAAVPGVNRNHLHEEPTVIPPMNVRHAFAHAVMPLWLKHGDNDRQSRTLATLRDTLLPKLLSGRA
jgi:type I restriction enzyme, S subunit